ncbi:voltage-gated chloride channel family protein [Undibacterium sp. SXout7W]|uniref:voltage-gated chloride channel family protein n=1 Tax=Undibacterium sp. SXout7W TaxID=3413049 RepID=UPI003BF32AC6
MAHFKYPEQIYSAAYVLKWMALGVAVAALAGSASALFLFLLDVVTRYREVHEWIIYFLPIAGFIVGWVYLHFGKNIEAGNNLLIDEIHDPKNIVPLRLAPLILVSTITSHLFGASVGREGTAVQMGGALADQITRLLHLKQGDRRILMMAGMSAGFSSVFGTPMAGAIFGLEVLFIGRMRYDAIFPCFFAAIIADQVGMLCGIHHATYLVKSIPALSLPGLMATLVAGAIFGIVGMLFARTTHQIASALKKHISYAPLRPLIGGILIVAGIALLGTQRYVGLGIPIIQEAFAQPLPLSDCIGKMIFTIISLGSGFKGGEVTPLFYIGATLGNALAPILHMPFSMLAALGFVAVFAGAANTPIASTMMAIELFTPSLGPFAAIACIGSYLFSGHVGIYRAQKTGDTKPHSNHDTHQSESSSK